MRQNKTEYDEPMHDTPTATDLPALHDLCNVKFDNSFVRELPGDPETRNVPRAVSNACYTRVDPTPVQSPQLLAWSQPVADLLGVSQPESPTGRVAELLGGKITLPGMQPYAARYGGHQFGHWAGQLGDGRAITLGEILGPDHKRQELQLKGAGRTPYSRTADGRAVLRSSVREFLCSESMHHLGVPTTRALSLVATGESVWRDMFYDGNQQAEMGAIVCRVSPSFVRFGNFEILAAQGELDTLKSLADYVIKQHFPDLGAPSPIVYARWFEEICRRTATLMAHWMKVGFVHGVMNTDNMSILGLTIDYGPYGWLEGFDLEWTPNTTDAQGRRYCFGKQPEIAQWNLTRLAAALSPLIDDRSLLERGLAVFNDTFQTTWRGMLADKLGLNSLDHEGDETLLSELFELLQQSEIDMTIFFRSLMNIPLTTADNSLESSSLSGLLRHAFYTEEGFVHSQTSLNKWLHRYIARIHLDMEAPNLTSFEGTRLQRMSRSNPKYVLRNYLAQQAIEGLQQGDSSFMTRLIDVLRRPYDEQPSHNDLASLRPEWARNKPGCSALSCSS